MKTKRIISLLFLLAFLIKVTASFGCLREKTPLQYKYLSNSSFTNYNTPTSDSKCDVNFTFEALNFENEKDDSEGQSKCLAFLYSVLFEIPTSIGDIRVFYFFSEAGSERKPLFILLRKLII